MQEADVIVAGAGPTGRAAAASAAEAGRSVLLVEKRTDVPDPELTGVTFLGGVALVDVITSADGAVAGALVTNPDAWNVEPMRAPVVVLATGGASALWPEPVGAWDTGDALAIAHRAGADVEGLEPTLAGQHVDLRGGVASGSAGLTRVDGLFVAGRASAQRVPGADAGRAAAAAVPEEARRFGDYAVMPNVDSPLPPGFVDVKFDRLRRVMAAHYPPTGATDGARARTLLHQLKGEADEYARARPANDLLSFRNACEVATLVAHRLA